MKYECGALVDTYWEGRTEVHALRDLTHVQFRKVRRKSNFAHVGIEYTCGQIEYTYGQIEYTYGQIEYTYGQIEYTYGQMCMHK